MRIAIFYPSRCIKEPIDAPNLWTSYRGLTGSELACVMYAIELVKLGHSVSLFTRVNHASDKDGVIFIPYEEWEATYCKQDGWDVACSWMIPDPLEFAKPEVFRLFNQQVSDFGQCKPGWEEFTDFLLPLSQSHANHMVNQYHYPREKYRVMHNGTNTDQFKPGEKSTGKMIWASSHDRGLHWLLEAFPKIKKRVPKANLHIFYNFSGVHHFSRWTANGDTPRDHFVEELGRRSRYVLEGIKRLEGKGVVVHESVSRDRIVQEMSTSEVLAYPLDPVRYTETFGVTVLEACASGVIPVICNEDAFRELWGKVSMSVNPPYPDNKEEFIEKVVQILSDDILRNIMRRKCVDHAKEFEWTKLAKKFDTFLTTRGQSGLDEVIWTS